MPQTSNFEFLAEHDPIFRQLAGTAEQVFAADPNTTSSGASWTKQYSNANVRPSTLTIDTGPLLEKVLPDYLNHCLGSHPSRAPG